MTMSTYYRAQAQRCLALSRACSDRRHEAQLTFMANRYFDRAGELEQGMRMQATAASQYYTASHGRTAVTGRQKPDQTGRSPVRTESPANQRGNKNRRTETLARISRAETKNVEIPISGTAPDRACGRHSI